MSVFERVLGLCMSQNTELRARIIDGESYLGQDDQAQPIFLKNNDHIKDSNFAQIVPTVLPLAYTGLTFESCNLMNVIIPPEAGHKVIDCLWIEREFCSNKHPDYVEKGLPVCDVNCIHLGTDGKYHDVITARHIGCDPVANTDRIVDED